MAKQRGKFRRLFNLGFPVALIVLAGWVFFNRQMLQDQIVMAGYDPPATIQALAEKADLSEQGKQRFYVNQPELHGKASFSKVCDGVMGEHANVLGCFTGNRIYIYDVPGDAGEALSGVEEVTAAHEMLHAAYARLGGSEKQRVNDLLRKQVEQKTVAPHVRELINLYEELESRQLLNEVHSILATEQRQLVPELEEYYSQYFADRQTVVSLAAEYRDVFNSLKQRQGALAAELDRLASEINESTAALNQQIAKYNARVEAFNRQASSGQMTAQEFDRRKAQLEAERADIQAAITNNNALRQEYEQKRERYESLALQFTELQNQIDSSPAELSS